MGKTAIAIRHVMYEDLGSFEKVLNKRGFSIEYYDAGYDDLKSIIKNQPDLLIVLGGPIGVYEADDYPFIYDELEILKKRIQDDLPTLGICLGCQLIAGAAGAHVYPGPEKVIGWKPITLTDDGLQSCFLPYENNNIHLLQWQGDTFDLPAAAVRLAGSDIYENQAFKIGNNILAVQFHPEVTKRGLEKWFIGHISALKNAEDNSLKIMRETTAQFADNAEKVSVEFFKSWVDTIQS